MVNIRDGMQDWDYLWAIGHYGAGDFTEPGYPIGDDIARACNLHWIEDLSRLCLVLQVHLAAGWLTQPYVSKYPTPEHRSTGVEASPTLTWQADSDDVASFNVYFGADRNAVLNATPASPEFKGRSSLS
jgi:hypothetical protein